MEDLVGNEMIWNDVKCQTAWVVAIYPVIQSYVDSGDPKNRDKNMEKSPWGTKAPNRYPESYHCKLQGNQRC